MFQILDEMDMWSLVEKNPKDTGVLEKHNTKVSLWKKKNSKKSCFCDPSKKNKTKWKSKTA